MTGPLKRPKVSILGVTGRFYPEDELQISNGQKEGCDYRDYRLRVQERRPRRGQNVYRPFHEGFDGIVGPTCLLLTARQEFEMKGSAHAID